MKNPWIAWFPGDYLNKTRHLTLGQHGAYVLLLSEYYISGPILARARQVLQLCQAHAEQEIADVEFVLAEFFVKKDGYYRNSRADEEMEKRQIIINKKVEAGRKGGLKKSENLAHARVVLDHQPSISPTHSQSHIEPKSIPPNPPFQGGTSSKSKSNGTTEKLTPREYKKICEELRHVAEAMVGVDCTDKAKLVSACARAGIEFDRAKYLLEENQ